MMHNLDGTISYDVDWVSVLLFSLKMQNFWIKPIRIEQEVI